MKIKTLGILLGVTTFAAILFAIFWSIFRPQSESADYLISSEPSTGSETILATDEPATPTPFDSSTETEISSESEPSDTYKENKPSEEPAPSVSPEIIGDNPEPISGNDTMEFSDVSDTVTAKDVTNLRSAPSTLETDNIVSQLRNGDTLSRTGINEGTGWSRLDYNGQTVYAVSHYLTTDLSYQPPVEVQNPNRITTQDGRVIIFADCDDYVTPKMYVNLRSEPSTSQGETTAVCQISSGTVVHRTGYSSDSGWSRVDYDGSILYVVSSMVTAANPPE